MLLCMHAKNALEKTGTPRDAEILDDIWYVFLDTHEVEKKQWESYQSMGDNVLRQCRHDNDDDQKNWAETISMLWPMLKRDLSRSQFFRVICMLMMGTMALYVFLVVAL